MNEPIKFVYGGKSFCLEKIGETYAVYRSTRRGQYPVKGQAAFRIINAYKRKSGELVTARRPRPHSRVLRTRGAKRRK